MKKLLAKVWKENEIQTYHFDGWNYDPIEDSFWFCEDGSDVTGFVPLTRTLEESLRKELRAK
jgi:hypothetical protein